jgi:hypothetical protein
MERRRLRIPPWQMGSSSLAWTQAMLALLGTQSDAKVARMLELATGTVARKRKELAIKAARPRCGRGRTIRWTRAMLRDLRRLPAAGFSARYRVSEPTVRRKARACGIRQLPIRANRIAWDDAKLRLLGTQCDGALAARWGCTAGAVQHKRHLLGIPAFLPVGHRPPRTAGR